MLTEYVKSLKNKQNLTNAQIAQMSGVSESTISRLLKGDNKGTDLETAADIIRALGGSIDEAIGLSRAGHVCADAIKSCADCGKFASMKEEFLEMYTEEIRKDIVETSNQRLAEVYRINDSRVANEKAHYEQMLEQSKSYYAQLSADKDAMHQQRIDNLMRIVDARAKTINRLSLICGAMAICLIALLIINIFFPTNPILRW